MLDIIISCASSVYMPDQHTNSINKGLYMQSQIHCLHKRL